jgi:hypothetical protein
MGGFGGPGGFSFNFGSGGGSPFEGGDVGIDPSEIFKIFFSQGGPSGGSSSRGGSKKGQGNDPFSFFHKR